MLEDVTHGSPHAVTFILLLFGIGITAGNLIGGALTDWHPTAFQIGSLIILIASLGILYFAEPFLIPAVATVLVWGAIQFAAGAPLQARIVHHAAEAPNLAATLNQGAFNFGNAAGASLGGMMLTAGYTYRQLPIASAAVTVITLAAAILSARLDRANPTAHSVTEFSAMH
jgi:MFS transporter, DHA1 family, inner membrane transport protein